MKIHREEHGREWREELAWSAGLFDGEGSVGNYKREGSHQTKLGIAQVDIRVLERFQKAVGVGRIYGPRQPSNPRARPRWDYGLNTFDEVQAVIAMLWHWLGPVKREQAAKALRAGRPRNRSICLHGHAVSGRNRVVRRDALAKRFEVIQCRECKNTYSKEYQRDWRDRKRGHYRAYQRDYQKRARTRKKFAIALLTA